MSLSIEKEFKYEYKNRIYLFTQTKHNYGDLDVLDENGDILKTTKYKKPWYYEDRYYGWSTKIHQKNTLKIMPKRIFMVMDQILNLADGRINEYQIFYELELYTLSDFLKQKGILHTITIWNFNRLGKISEFIYQPDNNIKLLGYMGFDYCPERNKVNKKYVIFIKIYKGFINLCEKNIHPEDYKFGVYIHSDFNYGA
jgi:hypothetical protein